MDDENPVSGPVPREGDDPYGLGSTWFPNRVSMEIVRNYLLNQPEQGDWLWEDHCSGIAGGILHAIALAGRDVIPALGKAHWMWDDEINFHIPCCAIVDDSGSWCGNGPLFDSMIASGDCGEHG